MRQLTVGPSQNEQTIVEKGLSTGEMVVTEGTDKLQDGSHVELRGPQERHRPTATRRPAGTNTESGKSTAQAVK